MSFYGLVIVFVALCVAFYIGAFVSEMACISAINLAFARGGSTILMMSYLSVARMGNMSQAYINYTIENVLTR